MGGRTNTRWSFYPTLKSWQNALVKPHSGFQLLKHAGLSSVQSRGLVFLPTSTRRTCSRTTHSVSSSVFEVTVMSIFNFPYSLDIISVSTSQMSLCVSIFSLKQKTFINKGFVKTILRLKLRFILYRVESIIAWVFLEFILFIFILLKAMNKIYLEACYYFRQKRSFTLLLGFLLSI